MVELDFEIDLEAIERIEPRPLIAVLDLYRLANANEALRSTLLLEARRLQQENERTRAAIHDGNFGTTDLDECVVDAEAREGRQQMLDRRHAHLALDERGTEGGFADIAGTSRNVDGNGKIGSSEDDARVGRRRTDGHENALARV